MKKLLSVSAAALTLLASAALISCGTEGDDYSGATDTVLTLTSPSVSATAYPGVNYITWEPIAGAESFELYRTTDGESSSTKIAAVSGTKTEYADIAANDHVLSDGKSYKYTVIAVSSSDPSRAVYVKSSQASVSVTAIVPTAGTNVAAFTDSYSKSYFKKLDSTNLAKNVTVSTTDGFVYAEYPATAGFKYGVTILDANKYEALGNDAVSSATTANYKADYKAEFKNASAITSAGNYVAVAKIDSVSTLYTPTYVKLGSVEVKNIGESSTKTSGTSAAWIAENKARISWTPAKLKATGENTATTNYKVYRSSDADNTWVSVEGSVVSGEKETTTAGTTTVASVYYIDDTVEDNTIAYTYHVVHTDGTYYGTYTTSDNEDSLAKFAYAQTGVPTVSAVAYNNDTTGVADTIKIVATKNVADYNQTLAISYVKLADDADGNAVKTYAADSFTSITLANNNGETDSYTVYIKDAAAGTYLIKVTASETGKTDNTVYTLVTVDAADVSVNGVDANFGKFTISGNEVKAVTIVDTEINDTTDALSNYTYGLYKVVITETDKYNDIVKVETTAVNDNITLAKVTNASGDKLYEDYGLATGNYAAAVSVDYSTGSLITNSFYVKKALKSDAAVYAKKTVTGTYN